MSILTLIKAGFSGISFQRETKRSDGACGRAINANGRYLSILSIGEPMFNDHGVSYNPAGGVRNYAIR